MNPMKVMSFALVVAFLSMMSAPGTDATGIWIPLPGPLTLFGAAKLATMGLIGKGALLAGIGGPLVVKKIILGKAAAVAAGAGAIAGAKTGIKAGLIGSSIKAPLFLAKSAIPNLLSLAPLLKGVGKKTTTQRVIAAPVMAPMPVPVAMPAPAPLPMPVPLPPPVVRAPVYAAPAPVPVYAPPPVAVRQY